MARQVQQASTNGGTRLCRYEARSAYKGTRYWVRTYGGKPSNRRMGKTKGVSRAVMSGSGGGLKKVTFCLTSQSHDNLLVLTSPCLPSHGHVTWPSIACLIKEVVTMSALTERFSHFRVSPRRRKFSRTETVSNSGKGAPVPRRFLENGGKASASLLLQESSYKHLGLQDTRRSLWGGLRRGTVKRAESISLDGKHLTSDLRHIGIGITVAPVYSRLRSSLASCTRKLYECLQNVSVC